VNSRHNPLIGGLKAAAPTAGIVVPLAVLVALVSLGDQAMADAGIGALVDMVMAVGLFTFWGISGVLSFGHIAFVSIGAYTSALLTIPLTTRAFVLPALPKFLANTETSFVMATIVAAVVAAAFSALVAIPMMRLSGDAAGIASFALLIVVLNVTSNWTQLTGGLGTLTGVPTDLTLWGAYACAAVVIIAAAVYGRSRSGRRLRASREDEVAAQAVGVKVHRERRVAFVLSGAMMGVAGSMYAHWLGSFGPTDFYMDLTFLIVVMLIIGGLRSLLGAVVGAIIVSVLVWVLARWESGQPVAFLSIPLPLGFSDLVLAVVLVLILLRRPDGLTRSRELSWPSRKRRLQEAANAEVAERELA